MSSSKVREQKNEIKKGHRKDEFSCIKCEYKTKKETTLTKHMITKHKNHECKKCKENLPSFMALLKHIAEHEKEEKVKVTEVKVHGGTNNVTKDKEDKEDAEVNTKFVFS